MAIDYSLPPGIVYLSKQLPRLLAPAATCFVTKHALELYLGVVIPTWLSTLAYTLSGPLFLTVVVQYSDYIDRRDAAAAGAVMCPNLPGSIGGLNMLFTSMEDMYPGDNLAVSGIDLGYNFGLRFLFQNRIITAEPDNLKAILATDFTSFEKGEEFQSVLEPLLGTGVFASDGDLWKFHRQMTRPFFHRERISDFDLFDIHAENAIGQLKKRLRQGYPVDFQDMVSRFTLDAATSFLFARDMQSLSVGLPYPHYVTAASAPSSSNSLARSDADLFATAFQDAQFITSKRYRFGEHWPLAEFWKDKVKEPMAVVRRVLDPILEEAVAKKRAMGGNIGNGGGGGKEEREVQEGETLLDHLVNYTDDHTILRDEILNISVAGRDTTASLLTFAIYLLAEHPAILSKLRGEILRVVGPTRRPSFDDFREMKFMRAVLNETLRLYPPVPFNTRTARRATTFRGSNGRPSIYIPNGTRCIFTPIVMHRRKDLWGPDALEFDPERFLDERLHKYLTPNPFIFLPFNAGPRICLGAFAYHEASFFLVRLLQNFSSVSLAPEAQPPAARPPAIWAEDDKSGWKAKEKIKPRSHLTMFVYGGLWVKMDEVVGEEAASV
ncbi:cytochrome P450 [Roridomyces roridus]|uniref:Cytochrome P450 n=1 Tax=Roridomyces roridus TaxID=1738132 RepID=A0AAD7F803_9AGAR|nr:cytochrome P450 [Roridomyces roridus]